MKRTTFIILLLVALTGITSETFAQRAIGGRRLVLDDGAGRSVTMDNFNRGILIGATGPAAIDPFSSAMLTVDGLGTGGISPALTSPRGVLFAPMSTAQRNLIVNPANGLLVYNTTTNTYDVFAGGSWGAISGWSLVGNSLPAGGGGTGLGQNFLGSLNAQDVVIATNVGAPGSGAGERMRITSTGRVGFSATNSPFNPLMDFHIDGTNGVANVRMNSLGGAPLMVPALNLASDGITIAGAMGDLLKYDVSTVVGSVAWLRTSNNIVDGNNLFGTMAGSATTDVQMVTNGLPVMYLDGTTQFVGVGNSTPAYTLDVAGTLGSTGNSDIGTDPATNNTFGNNTAGTNQIGTGAQFNYIGDNATNFNSFGYSAVLNDFGSTSIVPQTNTIGQADGAAAVLNSIGSSVGGGVVTNTIGSAGTTNNTIGSGTSSTNLIRGGTDINVGINSNTNINTAGTGAVAIGNSNAVTINSSANDVTINTDAGATANDLVLNGIDVPNANFDILTINNAGDVNAVGRATGTNLTQQGISFDNEASGTRIRMGALTAGNGAALYPFLANRFVNLDNFTLSFNRGAATDNMLSLNAATNVITMDGATVSINDNAAASATSISGGTTTGSTSIGNNGIGSGPISLTSGRTVAGGDVTIATVDNAGVGADLVLTGIEVVNPMNGNLLWLTGASEVRQSTPAALVEQGITFTNEATGLKIRHGAREFPADALATNPFLENRSEYLGNFRYSMMDNAGNLYFRVDVGGATTQLGRVATTANTVTGTTNTLTATANNILGAGAQNQLTGATGNSVTATTGNNTVTATAGANSMTANTTNTLTAGTNNVLGAGAQNQLTGATGNSVTATTGNNTVTATAGANSMTANTTNTLTAGTNNILGAGAQNQLTGATGNSVTATTGNNTVTATAGANSMTANTTNTLTAGTNNVLGAGAQNQLTGATGNSMVATANNNTITAAAGVNALSSLSSTYTATGGDITLTVPGAASNNDIRMVGVDAALPLGTERVLFLNTTNDVRTRTFSALADEGLQYDAAAGAFKLGAIPAGTNPITTARTVRITGGSLTFDNGTGNLIALATNSITEGNATASYGLTSNQFNVNSATGALSDASGDVLLADNIDMQTANVILNIGNANTDFTGTGGLNLAGVLDGAAAANELGATTAARQLTVLGVVDATGTENNASAVWDLQVIGDLGASGMIKSGNSILIDGVSATRRIVSDAAMNISTTAGNLTLTSAGGSINIANPGNVLPSVTDVQVLGSAALRWDLFADNVNANSLTLPGLNVGHITYVNAVGNIATDLNQLVWDDATNRLGIGLAPGAATDMLDVNGTSRFRNAGTFDNTLTTTGTHTANGSSILNGTTQINGQLILANLSADVTPDDFFPVIQTAAGGTVETRQITELPFSGGRVKVTTPGAFPYNISYANDYVVLCTNAAAQTVNLPNAATNSGRVFIIKSRGAGNVNVGSGGGNIDGVAAPYIIVGGGNAVRTFVSNGTDWFIIGN